MAAEPLAPPPPPPPPASGRIEGQLQELRAGQEQLRRELGEARAALREHAPPSGGPDLAAAVDDLRVRLDALGLRLESASEHGRRLGDGLAEHSRSEERLGERLSGAEGRIAVLGEAWAREQEQRARSAAERIELPSAVREAGARAAVLQSEVRRLGDEVAALRGRGDREDELLELHEQQRAVRLRLEEQLRDFEARLAETLQQLESAAQAQLALAQRLAGTEGRLGALEEALRDQRAEIVAHVRRAADADEQLGRRSIAEIERRARLNRGLLVRLEEGAPGGGEQAP